jgi:hypothetical protein
VHQTWAPWVTDIPPEGFTLWLPPGIEPDRNLAALRPVAYTPPVCCPIGPMAVPFSLP